MAFDRTLIASVNALDTVNIEDSLQNGRSCVAKGAFSHAEGFNTSALGECSHADGRRSRSDHPYSYVWNGRDENYRSFGDGTFCINPVNGLYGFYIGNKNLETYFQSLIYSKEDILAEDNVFTGNNTFGGRTLFDDDVTFAGTVSAYGAGTKVNFTGANVYTKDAPFVRAEKPYGDESLRAATVGYVFNAASGFIDDVGSIDELNKSKGQGSPRAASLAYVDQFAQTASGDNPGTVILYDSVGLNTDGTMTQKAIKEAIDSAIAGYPFATPTVSGVMYLFNDANLNERSTQGTMTQDAIVKYITTSIESIPKASPTVFGKTRMYSSAGENTDGTMTQLAINTLVQQQISQNVLQATEDRQGVMYLFNETQDILKNGSVDKTKSLYGTFTSDWLYRNKPVLSMATATLSGGMKLYETTGQNRDGTITQKWISEHIPGDATANVTGKVKLSSGNSKSDWDANDQLTTMTKQAILGLTAGSAVVDGVAGTMKLYSSTGNNTDGTITQKGISELLKTHVYLIYADSYIRVWSNQWCEQSGTGSIGSDKGTTTASTKEFQTNPYVFATPTGATWYEVSLSTSSSTSLTFTSVKPCTFNWVAYGFLSDSAFSYYKNNYM